MTEPTKFVGVEGAAQDFLSALSERPKIIKILLRFIFGEFAYHEFIFLANEFINKRYYMNYSLDDIDYNKKNHEYKYRSDFSEGFKKF